MRGGWLTLLLAILLENKDLIRVNQTYPILRKVRSATWDIYFTGCLINMSMIQAQLVNIRFFCGDKAWQFEQNLSSVDKVDFL